MSGVCVHLYLHASQFCRCLCLLPFIHYILTNPLFLIHYPNYYHYYYDRYLLDALFVMEPSKFISGCLLSLSSMVQMELPHINVITKCDCADKEAVEQVLDSEGAWMIQMMEKQQNEMFKRLTSAISGIVDDFMIVSFCMLDRTDEESIERVLNMTDHCIQYGEDAEPKEPREERDPDEEH